MITTFPERAAGGKPFIGARRRYRGDMTDVSGSDWAWITRFSSLGFSLSFAEGRTARGMLAAFGVDESAAESMTAREAGEEFGFDYPVVRAGRVGDWGFAFEELGRAGSDPDALKTLSAGGRVISVFRTGNAVSRFTYLREGVVICAFDPSFPLDRDGAEPDLLREAMRSVGLDPDAAPVASGADPVIAALELLTLAFDLRLDGDIVDGPLATGEVEPDSSWLDD